MGGQEMKPSLFVAAVILFQALTGCATNRDEVYYKVKVMPGETLISIATRYGTSWYAIARDNSIRDYRQVKVGDLLYVKPGPGGFLAVGDHGNGGFVGSLTYEEWRNGRESAAAKQHETGSTEHAHRPRGGFLFGAEDGKLKWPVSGGDVSSNYGPRWGRFHHGIDIRAPGGTPIHAAHDGKVTYSGWRGGYGRMIVVEDDSGDFLTYYAHCQSLDVESGDRVRRGQKIGNVGSSGKATGSHLHFEYRLSSGRSLNPMEKLEAGQTLVSSSH